MFLLPVLWSLCWLRWLQWLITLARRLLPIPWMHWGRSDFSCQLIPFGRSSFLEILLSLLSSSTNRSCWIPKARASSTRNINQNIGSVSIGVLTKVTKQLDRKSHWSISLRNNWNSFLLKIRTVSKSKCNEEPDGNSVLSFYPPKLLFPVRLLRNP